jgi:hypothetical protein
VQADGQNSERSQPNISCDLPCLTLQAKIIDRLADLTAAQASFLTFRYPLFTIKPTCKKLLASNLIKYVTIGDWKRFPALVSHLRIDQKLLQEISPTPFTQFSHD